MTAHRCLHVLKSHTEYKHTHKNRWITVSFVTPQGAILCTTEMWQIPSLINVETSPINIFISACAPCWKHIQGDFKLYKLISYLLRQLSMPTISPSSPNLPFLPPLPLCSFPSFNFFPFLHTAEWDLSIWGSHSGQRGLRTKSFCSISIVQFGESLCEPTHSLESYNMIRRLAHIW